MWDLNSSELSLVNYVKVTNRKTFQNKILPELNSKKHTPSPTAWVLRNCGIAQNSSCGIAQNLSFLKAKKGNFTRNDFCVWLRKLLLMRKERKRVRFVPQKLRKSFANGNPNCIEVGIFLIRDVFLMTFFNKLFFLKINWVFATNSDSLFQIIDVYNIKDLHYQKVIVCGKNSISFLPEYTRH